MRPYFSVWMGSLKVQESLIYPENKQEFSNQWVDLK